MIEINTLTKRSELAPQLHNIHTETQRVAARETTEFHLFAEGDDS